METIPEFLIPVSICIFMLMYFALVFKSRQLKKIKKQLLETEKELLRQCELELSSTK